MRNPSKRYDLTDAKNTGLESGAKPLVEEIEATLPLIG